MSEINLDGLGVALITPFDIEGKVDYNCLEVIADRLVTSGCDYIVVLGTTAETPTLSEEEKTRVRDTVAHVVKGRIPLVLGFSSNCTASLCNALQTWNGSGYNAILSATPFYNKPSQEGLYQHFKAVANASPLPIILYNVPGRTGVNLSADTTIRLANEDTRFIAIKEASGNLSQIENIIANTPDSFSLISGDDGLTTEIIKLGGKGVISVIANAAPMIWSKITHLALKGKSIEAADMQKELEPMVKMLFEQGNPTGIKGLMKVMGLAENILRLPLVSADNNLMKRMHDFVAQYPNFC